MSKKAIRVVFVSVATIMAFSIPLYGCSPSESTDTDTKITFDYNDGSSRPYFSYANEGDSVNAPATPTREGYTFSYWQTEEEGGDKITFPYTFKENTTLYAHWEPMQCTVTFDLNYDNSTSTTETVLYNGTVEEPAEAPVNGKLVFYYWQTKPDDDGSRVTFPYTVTGDVTFYARWGTGDMYYVTLDANGADVEAQTFELAPGDKITKKKVTEPERAGYIFRGWATTKDATKAESYPLVPSSTMTYYAVWEREYFNITFNSNYPDLPDSEKREVQKIGSGDTVDAPTTDPVRTGYTFLGWYTTSRGGTKVTFPTAPSGTLSYYAHWKLAEAVETTYFDAEFTEIDENKKYYGYSGEANGIGIIVQDTSNSGSSTQTYPKTSNLQAQNNYYVTYQYEEGDELIFEIYSDKAVSGATLYASLTTEIAVGLKIGPTGENAYKIYVNGTELVYNEINFGGSQPASGQYKGTFQEYTLGNISLVAGKNTIRLVTSNSNGAGMGGAMKAVAPMVDYIRIDTKGASTLSWYPIYDNIYKW
jgi:uncharacterized repeat protein (TIGR02543 family)